MTTSRVQGYDKSNDQVKVLARHTHTIRRGADDVDDQDRFADTFRASSFDPEVWCQSRIHLRRDWTWSVRYHWGPISGG